AGNWTGVWASSPDDVYVVGTGILHWDGSRWSTAMPDFAFADVWGSGPNDVYAVGSGVLAHWDGARWTNWDGSRWSTSAVAGPAPAGPSSAGPGGPVPGWNGPLESVGGSGQDDVEGVGKDGKGVGLMSAGT